MTLTDHKAIRFAIATLFVAVCIQARAQTAFNWSGFYIGGNAGGNWSHYHLDDSVDDVTVKFLGLPETTLHLPVAGFETTRGAFIGGGQAGYNFQLSQFVIGFEGDFDGASSNASHAILVPSGGLRPGGLTAERSLDSNWTGSARLRAGFAWQHLLFYATGGGAFADFRARAKDSFAPGGLSIKADDDRTLAGWAAGAGAEWAVTRGVSLGLEYRHSEFGHESYSFSETGSAIAPHSTRVGFSADQVTLRVNLLFNGLMGR